jgi:hypothetical protein
MTLVLEEQQKRHEEFTSEQKAAKPLARIEKWAVVQSVISLRFEALEPGNRLRGYVAGGPNFAPAKLVHTSSIVRVDLAMGLVETRNTIYQLGEVSEEYRAWYAQGCPRDFNANNRCA